MPFFDTPIRDEPKDERGFQRPGEREVGREARHTLFNVMAVLVGLALLWWWVVAR